MLILFSALKQSDRCVKEICVKGIEIKNESVKCCW